MTTGGLISVALGVKSVEQRVILLSSMPSIRHTFRSQYSVTLSPRARLSSHTPDVVCVIGRRAVAYGPLYTADGKGEGMTDLPHDLTAPLAMPQSPPEDRSPPSATETSLS